MLWSHRKVVRQLALLARTTSLLGIQAVLTRKQRARASFNQIYHMYSDINGRTPRWPVKSIFDLLPDARKPITIIPAPGEGIRADLKELCILAMITRALEPKRIFEIGTFRGRTALNFAINSPDDCQVFTLDLPPDDKEVVSSMNKADRSIRVTGRNAVGIEFQDHPCKSRIHQLFGDSTQFDYEPYVGTMDLVLVDGAHHYSAVVSDTRNALRLLKPTGRAAIIWHDFSNFGDYFDVTRAVLESPVGKQVVQLEDTQFAIYLREA